NKVIQKEMQLCYYADLISCVFVNRNHRLDPNLEISSRPDDARINRAGGLPLGAAVQRSFQCELHQRNQSIDRRWQMHVLHLRLQINHAVLQRKTQLQDIRMPLNLNFTFAGSLIHRDTARARARWNLNASYAAEGERLQKPQ